MNNATSLNVRLFLLKIRARHIEEERQKLYSSMILKSFTSSLLLDLMNNNQFFVRNYQIQESD